MFTVICFDYCLLWFVMLPRGFGLFVGGSVGGFVCLVCLGFGFGVWFVIWV